MTKEERIRAAITGEKPDTIPFSFWSHFPETDLDPEATTEGTHRFTLEYDIDLVETMNSGMYSVEDFGAAVNYSGITGGGVAKLRKVPVKATRDWEVLKPASIETGALKRELVYLEKLLEKVKGLHTPVVSTVFSPLAAAHKLYGSGLNRYVREEGGEALRKALSTIAQATVRLAARAIKLSASGVFSASQMFNNSMMNDEECAEYGKPYDLSVLKAAKQDWCNILYAHGNDVLFDVLKDYLIQIFNWHVQESLPDIEERNTALDKCTLGGMGRVSITEGDKNRVHGQVFHTIRATGGRNLILTPGCVARRPLNESMLFYIRSAKREIEQRLWQLELLSGLTMKERNHLSCIVSVNGSSHEQGFTQGKELKEVILRSLQHVDQELKESRCGQKRHEAFVSRNLEMMRRFGPALCEEMEGIAQGSGLPFADIVRLNIPAYFMTEYFDQECSMIVTRKSVTADGCTYAVRNRNMGAWIGQYVLKRSYPDGNQIVEVNGAGIVAYPAGGINGHGLCVTTTDFWSADLPPEIDQIDSSHIFLNIRLLLANCKTVDEIVAYAKQSPHMNGLNVLAADTDATCVVEMISNAVSVEYDQGKGVLFRTNHYRSDDFSHFNPEPALHPSTFCRSEWIETLLEQQYGKIRFQDLLRIISDHEDDTSSVCRHPQGEIQGRTVSCCLFVVEDLGVWTTLGNPCEQLPSVRLSK